MNKLITFASLVLLAAALPLSAAADIDGSKPLVCSVSKTVQCGDNLDCLPGEAENVHLPELVRVDAKKKQLTILDAERAGETTAVANVFKANGALILQGVENGLGWTMEIASATGEMTLAVVGHEIGFLAFGSCSGL
jgi:flavin reductase (DIM6/NTAB) family NADH-FMN oxidoreductase RutF